MNKYARETMFLLFVVLSLSMVGCGESADTSGLVSEKNLRMSGYISKGNFVEVASFAYQKVLNDSDKKEIMTLSIPTIGSKVLRTSNYNIKSVEVDDTLNKIIIQNHLNRIDIKFLDNDRIHILLQGSNFALDKKMSLNDFVTAYKGQS